METLSHLRTDIAVLDTNGRPILVVEVKTQPIDIDTGRRQLAEYLQRVAKSQEAAFGMLVDSQSTRLFRWQDNGLSEQLFTDRTEHLLSFYDSEFGSKPIFEFYLMTLVEAWLRDCAYHWKSNTPPGYEQLSAVGLTELFQDGVTVRDYGLTA